MQLRSELIKKGVIKNVKFSMALWLYHPLDAITNPKYKVLYFLTMKLFAKRRRH
jgi:hypothetical protein